MLPTRRTFLVTGGAAALTLSACSGGNSGSSGNGAGTDGEATGGGTLVIDTAFSIETGDPGHTYDPTGNMVAKAIYEPLVDFEGSDVSTPVPGLASWEQNEEATEFTFTLAEGRTFSDGAPITADDVVFTIQRVQGMTDAKPNFLLAGISVEKVDDATVLFTTEAPMLQLPAILANPALGIVNSAVVTENGGATDGSDTAQDFLNGASAGSGPYILETLDLSSQVVLAANPEYKGSARAGYSRVVIRNVSESATQLMNLQGGDTMVALDLNGDQVADLGDGLVVDSVPSGQSLFLLLNQSSDVAEELANVELAEAIRYALDYDSLLELAGTGSVQATGVIPPGFEGALPEGAVRDLDRAKAALAEAGYDGQTLRLQFPNDYPVGGVEFTPVAERIQAQLKEIDLVVELAPAPFATELDAYVSGREAFGLWFWGPDYADSANFLPFGPGQAVGLRAGWETEADPEIAELAAAAVSATDPDQREQDFTAFAAAMQEAGPFVPLIVPARNIAASAEVDGAVYNSLWDMAIGDIAPAS